MSERAFTSFLDFAVHMAEAAVAVRVAEHHALDHAAAIVEKDAKKRIGTYQEEVGPFAGWAPLAESTVKDRVSKGFTPDDPELRTGELRDSISRQVEGLEAAIGSTSDVMVWQELGTEKMPPRPILGPAAYANREKIEKALGHAVLHALEYGAARNFVELPE
jgi:HK97 gp10 family phage protein